MYKDLIQKSKLNFYVLAYLFIIAFTIWVSNSAYAFYRKYIETINTPETLMFLYIYRGDNVEFIWKLFLLFLFDGFIVFYLIRKISINQFYEYILNFIVLFISINLADIYTPHKLYSFLQNSFLFPVYALFILIFNSDYLHVFRCQYPMNEHIKYVRTFLSPAMITNKNCNIEC